MKNQNIVARLAENAKSIPNTPAIIDPRKKSVRSITFKELYSEVNRLAFGFSKAGLNKGNRVLLIVKPGVDLIAITYSLFRLGAVPVLIDPGLGRKNILNCIKESKPESMIGIPITHFIRILFPKYFSSVKTFITTGKQKFQNDFTIKEIRKLGEKNVDLETTKIHEPAAILFTSGSTGSPKGVVYSHNNFFEQSNALEAIYQFKKGDIDLPTFPLFALFSGAFGMTSIVPDMNPTQPARVDPLKILSTVEKFKVINSFGSPALWDTVTRYCNNSQKPITGIQRVLIAGAPVSGKLLESFDSVVDKSCKIHTPYGATEALPVASIERQEVLSETWEKTKKGLGVCVGKPVTGMKVKIIKITDDSIQGWKSELEVSQGIIGEVVVQSPWVTSSYFNRPKANELAKITDGDLFWHRMGDVGYIDSEGRIWFCGRKNHRVVCQSETLFTIPCEGIFNQVRGVKRSALVGIGEKGNQRPVLAIELDHSLSKTNEEEIKAELLKIGSEFDLTKNIKDILFCKSFPVDIRHNAKIFREKLAVWAEKKLR
jgi:acyl-coenzyme A synthetase/AMP-(fatty) acid ligase